MNGWELFLILAVVFILIAAKYGFDLELMLRDKKTLVIIVTGFMAFYVAYILVLDTLR